MKTSKQLINEVVEGKDPSKVIDRSCKESYSVQNPRFKFTKKVGTDRDTIEYGGAIPDFIWEDSNSDYCFYLFLKTKELHFCNGDDWWTYKNKVSSESQADSIVKKQIEAFKFGDDKNMFKDWKEQF